MNRLGFVNHEKRQKGTKEVKETRNPYEILNVRETATDQELKRAYRDLASKHHPNKHANDPNESRKMQDINWAWEEVSTPERRKTTDERLRQIREAKRQQNVAPPPAPPIYVYRPIYSPPQIQTSPQRKDPPWGAIFAGLGLGLAALWAASSSSSTWDPNVQRYRGRDGRFVGD